MVKSIRSLVHTVDGTVEKVDEVHDAVAGRKPSDLVPFPAPGLVQVVANHTKQLTKQGGQINDIQAMVQKLTAEPPLTKSDISTVAETVVAGVAEGVAEGVAVGVAEGVAEGVAVAVGVAMTALG